MENKIALITGGGSGIGRATAVAMAQKGYTVLVVGRTESALIETKSMHDNIDYFVTDVCSEVDVTNLVAHVEARYGKLDVLVNNAGIAPVAPLEKLSMAVFDQIFNLNVRAVVHVTREMLPLLRKAKGNVINIVSGLVNNPQPWISAYTASKAAVQSLTKSWAKEFAEEGIRFNAVAAGATDTPLYDKAGQTAEEEAAYKEVVRQVIPLKRFAQADEIAKVVTFLSSDDAKYATGAVYAIDGGFGI